MHGQSCRGVVVDCVRFVVGVLDELYHVADSKEPVPVIPPDASWHDPRGTMRVAQAIARRYPNDRIVGREIVGEPGDVIVMRTSLAVDSPGHVAIVGARRNTIWHANPGVGVIESGIGEAKQVMHVWRMKGKDRWLS
jgi:hypothetical protein